MNKPFAFALTPPEPAFEDVYELGIKGACEEVEFGTFRYLLNVKAVRE